MSWTGCCRTASASPNAPAGRLAAGGGGAVLQVVRCFGDTGGKHAPDAAAGERSLIGWHLRREVLDFLAVTGAGIDVDEYDMGRGEEQG